MIKYFLSFCFYFFYSSLICQNFIGGSILDSLKNPVPFCTIGLLNAKDSAVVKGNLSDENGKFIFQSLPSGNYLIKISQVGSLEAWSDIILFDSLSSLTLPPIILKNNGVNLKEVGIVTIKEPIEFKNGNITVNIDGSPLAIGNSVYDLLSRLPGVSVDNDNISIQGKGGVRIYIDERPQQMSGAQLINLLKSLNASTIEKIEVINNPPAKYDAAGDAGIINIRTKKIKLVGFSGSANLTYSQGFYENSNGGFTLNYKGKKITLFSNFTGNQGIKHNVSTFEKTVTYNGKTTQINQRLIDDYDNRNLVVDLGADWYIDKKNVAGAKVRIMPGYGINKDKGVTNLSDTTLGYNQLTLEKSLPNYWLMLNYNVNAEHSFDTIGTKLKLSGDYYSPNYDSYKGSYKNSFISTPGNSNLPSMDFISNNRLDLKILLAKIDFERKLSKTLSMEAGIKESYQYISSNYILKRKDELTSEYITDSTFTNTFFYKEQINAAYINFSKEIKKLNFQLGLRAENTIIHTTTTDKTITYKRNYSNVFPTISIDYNRSKDHIFSLGYNKRIGRPDYNVLNPYRSFVDILNAYQGNPYTNPAYAYNFSFNYAIKSSIYNSLTYTKYVSAISGYVSQNDSTKETTQYITNLNYFQILRYSFFIRKNIKKWWVVSFNFGTYYVGYAGKLNGQDYSLSAVPHYEWINNMLLLPKDLKIELTAYYWGPWLGIASRYKARGAVSLAVKKSFLNNSLNCSIGINDIFFSEVFISTADFQNQNWQRYESNDTRRLNLSLSYNFGKIKVEKRNENSDGEEAMLKK